MLVKAKSLRLVTPRETPLTSPCSIEGRFRTSARLVKIVRISLSSLEGLFPVPRSFEEAQTRHHRTDFTVQDMDALYCYFLSLPPCVRIG